MNIGVVFLVSVCLGGAVVEVFIHRCFSTLFAPCPWGPSFPKENRMKGTGNDMTERGVSTTETQVSVSVRDI